jgi:uncharacterized membrane protein
VRQAPGPAPTLDSVTEKATEEDRMGDLVAVGYDDEVTATRAGAEVRRVADELVIEPDAVAVIVRDREGKYNLSTSHHAVGSGASYGMFWGPFLGLLLFVPVFGMAVGESLGVLMAKVEKIDIDEKFQDGVRAMLKPGTSALFVMAERVTPDEVVQALRRYGGTVLKSSLSADGERELQEALHGHPVAA